MATVVPIFMYHNIAPVPSGIELTNLYVSPAKFRRQMRLLRWLGYRGLSMSAAMPYLRGEKHGRVAVITLDDGYADNVEEALPVLLEFGFSATCYVVSGRVGQYNVWDADRLRIKKRVMSVEQLRTWHSSGMEVGAHTRTHAHLTRCGDAELTDEVTGCGPELEDLVGAAVTQFCYPYGDVDDRVVKVVQKAGYHAATTTRRDRSRPGEDLFMLPRVVVARRNSLPLFAAKALTNYERGRR